MKTYFIFICVIISGSVASATTQTAANQDKPPHVYVKSYNMSEQVSGTYHFQDNGGPYAGYWENEPLTCDANFYGLMDGTNGLIGAGYTDMQLLDNDSDGYYSTFTEHMMEQDTNGVPALVDHQDITYTTNTYYNGTDTFVGWSFPIVWAHCDINGSSFNSASYSYEYESWSVTRRRGVQAILKLQTGGKATSKLRNVFGLSGSAVQAFPSFPSVSEDNWPELWCLDYENDHTSGTNIPSQNITIGSYGNLNSSGVLYKILPDNADVVVTPSVANMDYYTFNVSATKYLSYFDLYVQQANPGFSLSFSNPTNDVGHAFWRFRTDAPSDALQYISADLRGFLNTPWGFYPSGGLFTVPGQLQNDSGHSANISRTFYIGFSDLINGLEYTKGISNAPPVYVLTAFNCVGAARGAGFEADIFGLPWDESPQNFGVTLIEMYPAPGQVIGPFIDTNDVFSSSAPY
jgi:hypothetical protein